MNIKSEKKREAKIILTHLEEMTDALEQDLQRIGAGWNQDSGEAYITSVQEIGKVWRESWQTLEAWCGQDSSEITQERPQLPENFLL